MSDDAHPPQKIRHQTPDPVAGNVEKIRQLFPGCVTEAEDPETGELKLAVDFDALRQELSGEVVEGPRERYRLDWPGKREATLAANTPIAKTLRPAREESVNFDTTQNLFIEGDNLDALKLLQETYLGKVKMIFIDPPYNTGKEFIYDDDFAEDAEDYKRRSEQQDEAGGKLVPNPETKGRYHSDWLSMMLPRLKLARNLLKEDGVILIAIDDHEVANLRKLCDEVFGEQNFCGLFVWEKKKKPSFLNACMGTMTDHIVAFARDRTQAPAFTDGVVEDGKKYPFNNAGNAETTLTFPAGAVSFTCCDQIVPAQDMSEGNIVTELLDDVEITNGTNVSEFRLHGEWRYSQQSLDDFVSEGEQITVSKPPFRPNYVNRSSKPKKTGNLLSHRTNGVPTNEDATEEMRGIFGEDVMSHPKPVGLLKFLIASVTDGNDLIVDFFAGSATTAHATDAQNQVDGSSRRFLMVQLPELIEEKEEAEASERTTAAKAIALLDRLSRDHSVAEIAKERLRRVFKDSRTGFRVLKIDSSNFKDVRAAPDATEQGSLLDRVDNVKDDRSGEDLLFGVLLDWGVDLGLPIARETIAGREVFFVDTDALAACFEPGLDDAFMKALAARKPLRAVFRDASYGSDAAKINAVQLFRQLSPATEVRTL